MIHELKPVLKVLYCPIKKDWDQKIRDELQRLGLSVADLKNYTVIAIPETSKYEPYYQELN